MAPVSVAVDLLRRAVPAKHTDRALRALSGESPISDGHLYPAKRGTTPGMLIFSRKDQEYWAGGADVPG